MKTIIYSNNLNSRKKFYKYASGVFLFFLMSACSSSVRYNLLDIVIPLEKKSHFLLNKNFSVISSCGYSLSIIVPFHKVDLLPSEQPFNAKINIEFKKKYKSEYQSIFLLEKHSPLPNGFGERHLRYRLFNGDLPEGDYLLSLRFSDMKLANNFQSNEVLLKFTKTRNNTCKEYEMNDKVRAELLEKRSGTYRKEFEPALIEGVIEVGMTPWEAKLAGGAFSYEVKADQKKWKQTENPLVVMWAQDKNPDNSEIEMIFQNNNQFKAIDNSHFFRVKFVKGRVNTIELIN